MTTLVTVPLDLSLSQNEIRRLLPGAIEDVMEEITGPNAQRYPPNPAKREEYLAHERKRFERKVERLNALLLASLEYKMEIISA